MQRLDAPVMNAARKGVVPHRRPLRLFNGNSAHSSGYMWQRGACFYFGGRVRRVHYACLIKKQAWWPRLA